MVKQRKKRRNGKGFKANGAKARKINASTAYETCTEQLSPFGGLLLLIKFLDLIKFKEIFDSTYLAPRLDPKLGHHLKAHNVLVGIMASLCKTCLKILRKSVPRRPPACIRPPRLECPVSAR